MPADLHDGAHASLRLYSAHRALSELCDCTLCVLDREWRGDHQTSQVGSHVHHLPEALPHCHSSLRLSTPLKTAFACVLDARVAYVVSAKVRSTNVIFSLTRPGASNVWKPRRAFL